MTQEIQWKPARLRYRPLPALVSWIIGSAALLAAAAIVPGVQIDGFRGRRSPRW